MSIITHVKKAIKCRLQRILSTQPGFLGDYRFIDGEQDEQLIPKEANLEVNREWTEIRRLFS